MRVLNRPDYIPALRYRALTPLYDGLVGATMRERSFKAALVSQANLQAGQRVLDLASGTGTLAIRIRRLMPQTEVIGVDADPSILAIARRKAESAGVDVHFDQALSQSLPYPAAHFDRVVSSLFFHHLTWEEKLLTAGETLRVLKPGGELHVADWGRAGNALMRGLFLAVQCLDGFESTRDNVAGRLPEMLELAGFRDPAERRRFGTIFGSLALYSARSPEESGLARWPILANSGARGQS